MVKLTPTITPQTSTAPKPQVDPLRIIPRITTFNGKFYDGMTKEEAEKLNLYQKFVGIDFKDIDENNDGILDDKEILRARSKEFKRGEQAKSIKVVGAGLEIVGAGMIGVCGLSIPGVLVTGVGMLAVMLGNVMARKYNSSIDDMTTIASVDNVDKAKNVNIKA